VIAIAVADVGVAVEAELTVAEEERRLRYRLRGDDVALDGAVANRRIAFDLPFLRLLDMVRSRGVGPSPVVTLRVGGRRLRLRIHRREGGYACAVVELTERDLTRRQLGETELASSPQLALLLGYGLALVEAGVLGGDAEH
jgi:hypothetical protein